MGSAIPFFNVGLRNYFKTDIKRRYWPGKNIKFIKLLNPFELGFSTDLHLRFKRDQGTRIKRA